MKKLSLKNILIGLTLFLGIVSFSLIDLDNIALGQLRFFVPQQGGTGTSTAPTFGDVLLGNANGLYDVVSTSTLSDGLIIGGFTEGSVIFANSSGELSEKNVNLFWDNNNNFLGIGTSSPYARLSVVGETVSEFFSATSTTATSTFLGHVAIGTSTPTTKYGVADLFIEVESATDIGLLIVESSGETSNVVEIRDSVGTILFDIESNGQVDILHTVTSGGERALEVICDAVTFGNTICQQIDFIVGNIGAEDEESAQSINIEGSATTQGDVIGTTYAKTAGGGANFRAIRVEPGLDVIRHDSGTFADVDFALVFDDSTGVFSTTTTAFNSTGTDVALWEANNDIVYVGGSSTFGLVSWIFSSVGTKDLRFEFAHSAAGDTFDVFDLLDETDGGIRSNDMILDEDLLTNWVAGLVNGESQFWLRIKRTRSGNHTTPTEDRVRIVKDITSYLWDKNGDLSVKSIDLGLTTLLASRSLTVDTGGVFDINLGTASGDDFTIDTSAFVVEGDTGRVGVGTATPSGKFDVQMGSSSSVSALVVGGTTTATIGVNFSFNIEKGTGTIAGLGVVPRFSPQVSGGQAISLSNNLRFFDSSLGVNNAYGQSVSIILESDYTGTLGATAGLSVANPTIQGAAVITTVKGVRVADLTVGTNNRALELLVSSGSNKHNIYASGTAQNYIRGNVGIGSGTTVPTQALEVNGNILGDFFYGHMYIKDGSVATSTSGTEKEISGGFTGGEVNGTTFGGSHFLSVSVAGKYMANWNVSATDNGNDDHEVGLMINGVVVTTGGTSENIDSPTKHSRSALAILDLAVDDEVSLYVENNTATATWTIAHANLTLQRVGQ